MDLNLLKDQIETRRSIRKYKDEKIPEEDRIKINDFCKEVSSEIFTFSPVYDEPECFKSKIATFGLFRKVKNYIVVKCKIPLLNKKMVDIGYQGALVLLFLKSLSYGSCWVGKTFSKNKCKADLKGNEELVSVISFGIPAEEKKNPRYSKSLNEICSYMGEAPEWFIQACRAALKAPTALNKQEFRVRGSEEGVEIFMLKEGNKASFISYGIAKRFFELGVYPTKIDYKER